MSLILITPFSIRSRTSIFCILLWLELRLLVLDLCFDGRKHFIHFRVFYRAVLLTTSWKNITVICFRNLNTVSSFTTANFSLLVGTYARVLVLLHFLFWVAISGFTALLKHSLFRFIVQLEWQARHKKVSRSRTTDSRRPNEWTLNSDCQKFVLASKFALKSMGQNLNGKVIPDFLYHHFF